MLHLRLRCPHRVRNVALLCKQQKAERQKGQEEEKPGEPLCKIYSRKWQHFFWFSRVDISLAFYSTVYLGESSCSPSHPLLYPGHKLEEGTRQYTAKYPQGSIFSGAVKPERLYEADVKLKPCLNPPRICSICNLDPHQMTGEVASLQP